MDQSTGNQLIILTDGWMNSHLESGTDGSSNSTNDEPGNTKQWRKCQRTIVPLDVPD
jgi:hypothetical protein